MMFFLSRVSISSCDPFHIRGDAYRAGTRLIDGPRQLPVQTGLRSRTNRTSESGNQDCLTLSHDDTHRAEYAMAPSASRPPPRVDILSVYLESPITHLHPAESGDPRSCTPGPPKFFLVSPGAAERRQRLGAARCAQFPSGMQSSGFARRQAQSLGGLRPGCVLADHDGRLGLRQCLRPKNLRVHNRGDFPKLRRNHCPDSPWPPRPEDAYHRR